MINRFLQWFLGGGRGEEPALQVGGIFGRMTPEGMCGIDPSAMEREEIRRRLAALYRRHNHVAGSLDPGLRREAEVMLDAIVHCREKYVDCAA